MEGGLGQQVRPIAEAYRGLCGVYFRNFSYAGAQKKGPDDI